MSCGSAVRTCCSPPLSSPAKPAYTAKAARAEVSPRQLWSCKFLGFDGDVVTAAPEMDRRIRDSKLFSRKCVSPPAVSFPLPQRARRKASLEGTMP